MLLLSVLAGALLWQAWSAGAQAPPDAPPGQSKKPVPGVTTPPQLPPAPEPVPEPSPVPVPEPSPEPVPEPEPAPVTPPGATPDDPVTKGAGGAGASGKAGPPGQQPRSRRGGGRNGGSTGCAGALALRGSRPDLGPPNSTDRLVTIVSPLQGRGVQLPQALLRVAGPFPVAGEATWSNDWHAARCNPSPHLHKGIDIFASAGTPLVAVTEGRVTQKGVGAVSGLYVEITDADGVQYFYAHLSGFASDLLLGQPVATGDVLGYVGTTGNAQGTSPHVHLEVQPGGVPVPPKPFVDQWLARTEARAARWVRAVLSRPTTPVDGPAAEQPVLGAARLETLLDPVMAPLRERAEGANLGTRSASRSARPMWPDALIATALLALATSLLMGVGRRPPLAVASSRRTARSASDAASEPAGASLRR